MWINCHRILFLLNCEFVYAMLSCDEMSAKHVTATILSAGTHVMPIIATNRQLDNYFVLLHTHTILNEHNMIMYLM